MIVNRKKTTNKQKYTATFKPITDGSCQVLILATSFVDYAGNSNLPADYSWVYDKTPPTMKITSNDIVYNGFTNVQKPSFIFI